MKPLDAAAGGHHAAECAGHAEPRRDSVRAGVHLQGDAGRARRGHRPLGRQGELLSLTVLTNDKTTFITGRESGDVSTIYFILICFFVNILLICCR